MSALENIRKLPSFRKPRDEIIPRKVMGRILEAARNTPSPGNIQSLEFIVVEDEEKKNIVSRATDDRRAEEAPTLVLVISDFDRLKRRIGERANRQAYSEASIAVQNMRLVAAEEGIATVWVGGFDEEALSEKFSVPEGKKIVSAVFFAYTDEEIVTETRFDLRQICFYDEYDNHVESFWDTPGWRGLREESRIHGKKARGLKKRVASWLDKYL